MPTTQATLHWPIRGSDRSGQGQSTTFVLYNRALVRHEIQGIGGCDCASAPGELAGRDE